MMVNYKLEEMNKAITFCTMCFNIGSENFANMRNESARTNFEEYYLKPLKKLCLNFSNLVIYCDRETLLYLKKENLTEKSNIRIVVLNSFRELKRFRCEEQFKKLTKKCFENFPEYRKYHSLYSLNSKETDLQAIYSLLVLSKIDIIEEVSRINPYETEFFAWIDSGCFQEKYNYFWHYWKNSIKINTKKFKCCINTHEYIDKKTFKDFSIADLVLNPCKTIECVATFFIIHVSNIENFYRRYNETLLKINRLNLPCTEQAVWTCMIKCGYENLFYLVKCNNYNSCIGLTAISNQKYTVPLISLQRIFSVKNQYTNNKKHKVITILGLKFKIAR